MSATDVEVDAALDSWFVDTFNGCTPGLCEAVKGRTRDRMRAALDAAANARQSRYPRAAAVLRSLGINPNEVPEDGNDRTGYLTVNRQQNTGPDGRLATTRHPWPTADAWERFALASGLDVTDRLKGVRQ